MVIPVFDKSGMVNNKNILIVEDSPTQAMHLKTLLLDEGLVVFIAINGQKALEMAQDLKPDLILLDVQLPDINGFQVCQKLKANRETSKIPVIILTRHDDKEAMVLGKQIGVVEYIPKDAFADAVLLETLRQMNFIEPATC